jgi:hypothetical protein
MSTTRESLDRLSYNQLFGFLFGAVYVVVGVVGFAITSGLGFAAHPGKELIIFSVNPLHNVVHIAVGGLLILGAALGFGVSRAVNGLVGAVYFLVGVLGLFVINSSANILAINHPDNGLHLATALLALVVALSEQRAGALSGGPNLARR